LGQQENNEEINLPFEKLSLLFGGGVGAFGRNLSLFIFNNFRLWIDAGVGFPHQQHPGLEKTIPSMALINKFAPDVIILTHGHEDHIGAVTFLAPFLKKGTPVYLTSFTLELLKVRFREKSIDINYFNIHIVSDLLQIKAGPFQVQFFDIPHSIPQSLALGITIDKINIKMFYTGDFRLPEESGNEKYKFAEFGPVDFLFCDSTGAMSKGSNTSEKKIKENMESVIKNWPGRVFFTTFSSQIERIQHLYEVARHLHRPLGILGKSLRTHIQAAYNAEKFSVAASDIFNPSPSNQKSIWIVAGCQGESNSALYRMANESNFKFTVSSQDMLIYSASVIPGNSEPVFDILNKLIKKGVYIYGPDDAHLTMHTSGHGKSADVLKMIDIMKPKTLCPIHGDPLHFQSMSDLSRNVTGLHCTILNENYIYTLNDKQFSKINEFTDSAQYFEAGSVHNDYSLYVHRNNMATDGVCNVVIDQKKMQLIDLQYLAVIDEIRLNKSMNDLKKEIERHIEKIKIPKVNEKKLIQKITRLNVYYLQKKPFVNLQWINIG